MSLRTIARITSVITLVSLAAVASSAIYWHEKNIGWGYLQRGLGTIYEFSAKTLGEVSTFKTFAIISIVLAFEPFVIGWKESSMARLLLHRRWSAILDCLWLAVTLFNLTFFL